MEFLDSRNFSTDHGSLHPSVNDATIEAVWQGPAVAYSRSMSTDHRKLTAFELADELVVKDVQGGPLISGLRAVWTVRSDSPRGRVSASEYCGGQRARY